MLSSLSPLGPAPRAPDHGHLERDGDEDHQRRDDIRLSGAWLLQAKVIPRRARHLAPGLSGPPASGRRGAGGGAQNGAAGSSGIGPEAARTVSMVAKAGLSWPSDVT